MRAPLVDRLNVPCDAISSVTVTGPITHLCPHVEEVDEGAVTITWVTSGSTLELHALAEYLRSWRATKISHEGLATAIAAEIAAQPGISDVNVTARFVTAGLGVEVSSALPRDSEFAGDT